jgi:hypothetical protein
VSIQRWRRPLSFVRPSIACACHVMIAVMWLLPDPRIEKAMEL